MKSSISSGFRHWLAPSWSNSSSALDEPRLDGAVLADMEERADLLELTEIVSDLSPGVSELPLPLLGPPVPCGVRLVLGVWKLELVGDFENDAGPSSVLLFRRGRERLPENSVSLVFLLINIGSLGSGVCIRG